MTDLRCFWCGADDDGLFHLEGARLAGSPPLHLNLYADVRDRRPIAAPLDALAKIVVCRGCAVLFGRFRQLVDADRDLGPRSSTVEDRLRRYVRGDSDAD